MSTSLVTRLRSPTFTNPPAGLRDLRLLKYGPDSFKLELVTPDESPESEELSKAIGYALWDIMGSNEFATTSEFTTNPKAITEALDSGGPDDPKLFRISRAWWYQQHPIFSNPREVNLEGALCDSSEVEDSSLQDNPVRIPQSQLPPPTQTLYERYIAELDSYFCLSIFGDSGHDLDLLHKWLNDPRVDEFWKDAGTYEFHVKWLRQRYEDQHVLPVLGSYRGTNGADQNVIEPFAYYEIYWAAEDKIARAYTADPFDRGIHMLVGSSAHRGPHRVRSWLPSLVHYIFNDDHRTQRILSEPDHKNLKMISYLEQYGFKKMKEFDMGHKIAAIMVIEREAFWENCPL
ncbi:hypothetical protein KEM48_007530 [Puccinia striiformis f. sp. tritici PST-130]|nr:hypothetical protein KEM48_007530 [Puccinia striiformis f. sp. tritici PST-130]